jgi:hypothetical protein
MSEKSQAELPVSNSKMGQDSSEELIRGDNCTGNTSCMIPDTLGPIELLPAYLEQAEDNEEAA